MSYEWDDDKNEKNIKNHGIDFHDSHFVFENPMLIKVDDRKDYGEKRFIGLGLLFEVIIVIVFTKRSGITRVISIRRANKNERKVYQEKFTQQD
ncbi:MAG TPA: BrnT family toxin [Gammaproteobacteria bacterium]|nr:BrnT family toxin [Gammaproteobacteria bacterium]